MLQKVTILTFLGVDEHGMETSSWFSIFTTL